MFNEIKAVGFDFGETLLYYGDAPLSWQSHYREAFKLMIAELGHPVTEEELQQGETILTEYNTRVTPRVQETDSAATIFGRILSKWGHSSQVAEETAMAFFQYFRQGATAYTDTEETLHYLHRKGLGLGIFSDVPYGMPAYALWEDIEAVGKFRSCLSTLVTSLEIGWRKPEPVGFLHLAKQLGVTPEQMLFVGNERKDVIGANRAGMVSVLLCRNGDAPDWEQNHTISTLTTLKEWFM